MKRRHASGWAWLTAGICIAMASAVLPACGAEPDAASAPEERVQAGLEDNGLRAAPRSSWSSDPVNVAYIRALPTRRVAVYRSAREKWDTGVTAEMHAGNRVVTDFLKEAFVGLAAFYPEGRFEGRAAQPYKAWEQ